MLIAVDTGGTKTLVASFTPDGKVVDHFKFPTPRAQQEYINQLQATIKQLLGHRKPSVISIAMPGLIRDSVATWCPNIGWKDFDVREPLKLHFPKTPIIVENDANLGGLGETRMLPSIPTSSLYVTISTGIGTGFVHTGRIDKSLRYSEGGQMLLEYDGVTRSWESFAAGSSIYKAYGKYARDITNKRTWNQIADRISRGFLAVIPLTQPEVIIIGGSIGTYFDQYNDQLQAILQEKLPQNIPCPVIRQALKPEEAVIYGCYYHALDEFPTLKHKS